MDRGPENPFGVIKSRIYSPDQVFQKISRDKEFSSKVVGVSSFSIEHINKNITSSDITIAPYGPQNIVNFSLNSDVYKAVFGEDHGFSNLELIADNASYGRFWACLSLAEEYGAPRRFLHGKESFIHNLVKIVANSTSIKTSEVPLFVKNLMENNRINQVLSENMGGVEKVTQFLLEARDRRGVQVVYGASNKNDFADFLRNAGAKAISEHDAQIQTSIPNRFVMALIPLGKFEKDRFDKTFGKRSLFG